MDVSYASYVDLVALLALLQMVFFMVATGRMRDKTGIKAPAITGDERFERMYRVQMNSTELIVIFLPSLYISSIYMGEFISAGLGAVYVLGRFIYWRAYMVDPSTRTLGFVLSAFPTLILIILGFVGFFMAR